MPSTKPHRAHPNFVFQLGTNVWVTRLLQKDAICLTQPDLRIDIGIERTHDGLLHQGMLYFTTVDGQLVVVDSETLQTTNVLDLKTCLGNDGRPPGWCRGVMVVDDRRVWVGFTRIRKTAVMQNLNWAKHGFREIDTPTHIALYDLVKKECLKVVDLEGHGINILFGIHTAD